MKIKSYIFLYVSCIVLCFTEPVLAQDMQIKPRQQSGLVITVGAAPVYSPVFQGSKDYGFSIFPDLRIKYNDNFSASVPEGIRYNLVNKNGWEIGPIAKLRFGREESTGGSPFLISGKTDALRGMGDIDAAVELGGFVQHSYEKIRTRLELRQGFGGHDGYLADASVRYIDRFGTISYSIGPQVIYGSSDYMNTYFGINPIQSTRSGLAQYQAQGGIASYGIGGSATVPLYQNTAITLFGGYDRLGKESSESTLVEVRGNPNQLIFGMAFGYRFSF